LVGFLIDLIHFPFLVELVYGTWNIPIDSLTAAGSNDKEKTIRL
jgi:hypothetical protein